MIVTFTLSFALIALAVAAMSIGVIAGREPIRGSCGGLSGGGCALCTKKCKKREDSATTEAGDGHDVARRRS